MSETYAPLSTLEKLLSETAQISWLELQRFFAQGAVMQVSKDSDLVQTALLFADDKVDQLKELIDKELLAPPSDEQARAWFESEALLWSVVVAPFVLVQDAPAKQTQAENSHETAS